MNTHRKLRFSLGLTLLPLFPIMYFYRQLPNQMGINFNFDGSPNGLVPKFVATFGVVILFILLELYYY